MKLGRDMSSFPLGLFAFLLLFTSCITPSAIASTLPKCPTVATIVTTPQAAKPAIESYVKKFLHNGIKHINPKSMLKSGPEWSEGDHWCYYTDPNQKSGYGGFLPPGVKSGYEVSIDLTKQSLSGATTMFLEFAKIGNVWKVLSAGTGP